VKRNNLILLAMMAIGNYFIFKTDVWSFNWWTGIITVYSVIIVLILRLFNNCNENVERRMEVISFDFPERRKSI